MTDINLSYVITTRNKLPYLREVMKRLLVNVQKDEEIIVVDAGSTDGTVEYLTVLSNQGEIHQFISEPDKGEAHGYNKGFLMARGKLIKDLTDDDTYYYPAIQECKKFMLEHEDVDVTSANIAEGNIENVHDFNSFRLAIDFEQSYKKWLANGVAVKLNGLPFMIRRKSLALTGLYSTAFIDVDVEYSLRITHLNANIAWNTKVLAVRLINPQSNGRWLRHQARFLEDRNRMLFFYDTQYRKQYFLRLLKTYLYYVPKNKLVDFLHCLLAIGGGRDLHQGNQDINSETIKDVFKLCDRFMEEYNRKNISEIICKS